MEIELATPRAREPRSRINEWTKFILMQVNFFFAMFGITLVGLAIYVLAANWGSLDPSFFTGAGVVLLLFGLIVTCVAYLGCQAVQNQRKKSPYTEWQGMRLLFIYQICITLALVAEIYYLAYSLDGVNALRLAAMGFDSSNPPPYGSLEASFSTKFNGFFFAAQLSPFCPDLKYVWFWSFVNSVCGSKNVNMQEINCLKCNDYSVTSCDADAQTCYTSGASYKSAGCPYNVCRKGILDFIYKVLAPFSYFIIAFVLFHVILLILNCMLMCYNPRDTDEKIRAKNGIFSAARAPSPNVKRNPQDGAGGHGETHTWRNAN